MNVLQPPANALPEPANIDWRALAPGEHVVLLYAQTAGLLDTVESFVTDGLLAGEGVIVAARAAHRVALQERLLTRGFNLASLRARHQYIVRDAHEALAAFMVQNWPDEQRFEQFFAAMLRAAQGQEQRPVRVFGEPVNILWGAGRTEATRRLEELWDKTSKREGVLRLCAYPQSDLTPGLEDGLQEICALHSRVILA